MALVIEDRDQSRPTREENKDVPASKQCSGEDRVYNVGLSLKSISLLS